MKRGDRRPAHLLATALAALLLLALPVTAAASPPTISLAEYRDLLQEVRTHLKAAQQAELADPDRYRRELDTVRQSAGTQWRVRTPHGEVTADHRPLIRLLRRAEDQSPRGQTALRSAMAMVQEMERAAARAEQAAPQSDPEARRQLEEILAAAETHRQWVQWLGRLLERLFPNPDSIEVETPSERGFRAILWTALILGAIGVVVLAWNLVRTLSGHGVDQELELPQTREGGAWERPLTPAQMRLAARQRAEAGDYQEALRLLHRALLLHYDRLGLIRYVPAQTNREHERMLHRHHPELARKMGRLNDLVDVRLYSGHGATAEDVATAESMVEELWRGGDEASRRAPTEASGASSPA